MTRLILDHFRRWSWVLGLDAVLTLILGWFICAWGGRSFFMFYVLMVSMWMGAVLLQFDLKHNLFRTVLALPLTARQIGRGWWFATVGIPAMALAALLFLGAAAWSHCHPGKVVPVPALAAACLFCLMWLGNTFASIYGMTNDIFGTWRERGGGCLMSLLSMVMFFGSMLLSQRLLEKPAIFATFLGIGAFLTAAGWVRAERFVLGRASFRLPELPAKLQLLRQDARIPAGYGGIPLLMRTHFVRGFLMLAAMITLMGLLGLRSPGMPPGCGMMMVMQMGSFMSLFLIILFHAMPAMQPLRVLRTLPISTTRLAALIVAIAILPLIAVGGLGAAIAGVLWGKTAAIVALSNCASVLVPAALSMFIIARFGTGRMVYVLLALVMTGYGMAKPMVQAHQFFILIPFRWSSPFVALCVLLAVLLTRHALLHSSSAYRAQ